MRVEALGRGEALERRDPAPGDVLDGQEAGQHRLAVDEDGAAAAAALPAALLRRASGRAGSEHRLEGRQRLDHDLDLALAEREGDDGRGHDRSASGRAGRGQLLERAADEQTPIIRRRYQSVAMASVNGLGRRRRRGRRGGDRLGIEARPDEQPLGGPGAERMRPDGPEGDPRVRQRDPRPRRPGPRP